MFKWELNFSKDTDRNKQKKRGERGIQNKQKSEIN